MSILDLSDQMAGESPLTPALGIVIDVVDYGCRRTRHQQHVQERLSAVVEKVLCDTGVLPDELQFKQISGDGMAIFLPATTDLTRTLPRLLAATATRLSDDNDRYRDQIRIRMAIGFGLAGWGPLGMIGRLMIELSRLNDSLPIRKAVADHPESNLVALISHVLYELVDQPGHPPNLPPLDRVEVTVKEYAAPAWMWVCNDIK